jgi:hypothetical protein
MLKQSQQLLLNTLNISLDEKLNQHFKYIYIDNNNIVLVLSDYIYQFDETTKTLQDIALSDEITKQLANIKGYVNATAITQDYEVRFYYTHDDISTIEKLISNSNYDGKITVPYADNLLQEKQKYISITQQEIVELQSIITSRETQLDQAKQELSKFQKQNSDVQELIDIAVKKGWL